MITVGITCFREGEWLRECWESVLAQTDDRWEAVIVMDGGADDATRAVFEAIQHPRLTKYALTANEGPSGARNKAFELSRTPYHFYLDADDQLLPDAIRLVLETFAKYPDAGFVYGDYERFGVESSIKSFPHSYGPDDLVETQCVPGACAYRVDTWKQVGGFPMELSHTNADYDFHIGLLEAGFIGRHCGGFFYRQRLGHAGQVSSSFSLEYHLSHEITVRLHPLFFQNRRRRLRYLAIGYRIAALANRNAKNRTEAARLAAKAIICGCWRDGKLWRIIMQRYVPQQLVSLFRHAKSLISARVGARATAATDSHR